MNMQDVYEEMKRALDYFGLRFHEMDKVQVIIEGDQLIMRFGKRAVVIEND